MCVGSRVHDRGCRCGGGTGGEAAVRAGAGCVAAELRNAPVVLADVLVVLRVDGADLTGVRLKPTSINRPQVQCPMLILFAIAALAVSTNDPIE